MDHSNELLRKRRKAKQLESLKRAREAAALKKRELKELAQKAKALPKKEIEVKAAEYDKLEEKNRRVITKIKLPRFAISQKSTTLSTHSGKYQTCNIACN